MEILTVKDLAQMLKMTPRQVYNMTSSETRNGPMKRTPSPVHKAERESQVHQIGRGKMAVARKAGRMKKSEKLDWSLSAGKRPTVTNVASNIQIAQYKEPYLSQCSIYFEWYCPVCNEIHWAVEACCSYPAVNVHCLSIELTCSHTMVYMPWMKEGESEMSTPEQDLGVWQHVGAGKKIHPRGVWSCC